MSLQMIPGIFFKKKQQNVYTKIVGTKHHFKSRKRSHVFHTAIS